MKRQTELLDLLEKIIEETIQAERLACLQAQCPYCAWLYPAVKVGPVWVHIVASIPEPVVCRADGIQARLEQNQ